MNNNMAIAAALCAGIVAWSIIDSWRQRSWLEFTALLAFGVMALPVIVGFAYPAYRLPYALERVLIGGALMISLPLSWISLWRNWKGLNR